MERKKLIPLVIAIIGVLGIASIEFNYFYARGNKKLNENNLNDITKAETSTDDVSELKNVSTETEEENIDDNNENKNNDSIGNKQNTDNKEVKKEISTSSKSKSNSSVEKTSQTTNNTKSNNSSDNSSNKNSSSNKTTTTTKKSTTSTTSNKSSSEDNSVDTTSIDYKVHKGRIDCTSVAKCQSEALDFQFKYKKSVLNSWQVEVISKSGKTLGYFNEFVFKEYTYSSDAECNKIGSEIKSKLSDRIKSYSCNNGTLKIKTDYD